MTRLSHMLCLAAFVLPACGGGSSADAGGDATPTDAPAHVPDAGSHDAQDARDAHDGSSSHRDARTFDGTVADGSTIDGNAPDARDAGQPDAHDAGQSDARDAGQPDASCAFCYQGQTCVGGSCAFTACTGSHVPGDYATVQSAVNALSQAGGTICLGAQTYAEDVAFQGAGDLVFQGAGRGETIVRSIASAYLEAGYETPSTVTFSGLSIGSLALWPGTNTVMTILASTLGGVNAPSGTSGLIVNYSANQAQIVLDGVDISATGAPAVMVGFGVSGPPDQQFSMVNSYVHDSPIGVRVVQAWTGTGGVITSFENNTIEGNDAGFSLIGSQAAGTLALYNNLFVGNGTALDDISLTVSQSNNAYYGNTTNFAENATDGANDVKTDPDLDTSTAPPGLLAGSPCKGAGTAAHAPSHDFFGRPRAGTVDIGGVQSSQ